MDEIMTAAQRIKDEAIEEGKLEGKLETARKPVGKL